ncbi:MAG: hypothetical protein C4345_04360, partial [Chloroflexota bacterium]
MARLTEARVSRRTALAATAGGLLGMPLSRIGTAQTRAQQGESGPIRWSLTGVSDLTSLDPAKAADLQGFTVIGVLYAGLVRLNEELQV